MTVDQMLNLAITSLKKAMPEAIFQGSLVSSTRAFDASISANRIIENEVVPAEIVFDSFTSEEIAGTNILSTDVKLIIIADKIKSIEFYNSVRIGVLDYKIKRKIETVVGSNKALFTIVAEL